jgi:hypothetical protein
MENLVEWENLSNTISLVPSFHALNIVGVCGTLFSYCHSHIPYMPLCLVHLHHTFLFFTCDSKWVHIVTIWFY